MSVYISVIIYLLIALNNILVNKSATHYYFLFFPLYEYSNNIIDYMYRFANTNRFLGTRFRHVG